MSAIIQADLENILRNAAWSGTAPSATYSLDTYARFEPSARIRYGATSATVTATIASARGDIVAIPVANATGLTITNNNGLSEVIPVPAMPTNGIPLTIVADLTLLEPNAATRTATVWNFAFTGGANLVIGAYIGLFSPRTEFLFSDFQWGLIEAQQAFGIEHENDYGVRYRQTHEMLRRVVTGSKMCDSVDKAAIQNWHRNSWGKFGTALLWPDPTVNDALVGTIADRLEVSYVAPVGVLNSADGRIYQVRIAFEELSKGKPV